MFHQVSRSTSAIVTKLLKTGISSQPLTTHFAKMSASPVYQTLAVSTPVEFVFHVELNRPNNLNAMNRMMWIEIGKCFEQLNSNEDCRAIVLSGTGKIFTAGLDFKDMMKVASELAEQDVARKAKRISESIHLYQNSITMLEICKKPVIAAIHSACVGGGVDLITAADIRYCSKDAWFQVKEVDIGMAADVGTLQRLPKVVGSDSLARELCYSARKFLAAEALSCGMISRVFEDRESVIKGAMDLAALIAKKSPVAVQGTKTSLVYSRDHSVQEGLDHIGLWNQMMLQSEDLANAVVGQIAKNPDTVFAKL